jgi:serine phosphatase RsbU (regulator of sigma subunit)
MDEEYGETRLAETVRQHGESQSGEIVQHVTTSIHSYIKGTPPADDITLVIARKLS